MRGGALRAMALGGTVALGLACSTLVVGVLEASAGIPNASALYIVVVAGAAFGFGIAGAVATAVISIGVYDYLYTEPRYTLAIAEPAEWLSLLLLLFVAITVGQLAAVQQRRAEVARARERESRALFGITRALATRSSLADALPSICDTIAEAIRATSLWIALGPDDAREQVVVQR